MQLTTLLALLTSVMASVPAAALAPKAEGADWTGPKFSLVALRPGTAIHEKDITASNSQLWVSRPGGQQGAQCNNGQGTASGNNTMTTLFIKDNELLLYGGDENSHQQFAVDTEKAANVNWGPDERFETKGRTVDLESGFLSPSEEPFIACPGSDDSYTVSMFTRSSGQELLERCILFNAQTKVVGQPVSCEYSEE
ncbi:uncharacterized protein C8A04DRAFT_29889 [Dichotomopilus funicola]|uniref:Cell wall protein PhiA n=1 Tax=Dichotomopilus funicola TaxID=1934379 RepID=A0AAN6V2Q2_9PEZI|nr:hypothetical protein C8A04DRAFT_29889 [Dichotomopilus funicola]